MNLGLTMNLGLSAEFLPAFQTFFRYLVAPFDGVWSITRPLPTQHGTEERELISILRVAFEPTIPILERSTFTP